MTAQTVVLYCPMPFLACDELLKRMKRLLVGLRIDDYGIQQNLEMIRDFRGN